MTMISSDYILHGDGKALYWAPWYECHTQPDGSCFGIVYRLSSGRWGAKDIFGRFYGDNHTSAFVAADMIRWNLS